MLVMHKVLAVLWPEFVMLATAALKLAHQCIIRVMAICARSEETSRRCFEVLRLMRRDAGVISTYLTDPTAAHAAVSVGVGRDESGPERVASERQGDREPVRAT
jgi:hypothetical protein